MDRDDRLTISRLRLMLDEPYLASALARLPFVDATTVDWCDTMATDGFHIFYDRPFVETLSDDELKFVIAHELFHCVLGHIDRRASRDALLWNCAIDYATNTLLVAAGLPMPSAGLFSHDYTGMTAEEIFDHLRTVGVQSSVVRRAWPGQAIAQSGACDARDVDHAGGPPGDGKTGSSTERGDFAPGGFDRHLSPEDDRIKVLGPVVEKMPSEGERRRLRKALNKDLLAKLGGTAAGRAVAEVQAATNGTVPWEALLRHFVTSLRRSDYRMFPFNKKHLWRGLYLPSVGTPGPQHLLVAVDTSGSMSETDLAAIAGELDVLRSVSECMLTVLHFDVAVTHVEVREAYQPALLGVTRKFFGRGGTDIRAPFEWMALESREGRLFPYPDALIVITDGFGTMPSSQPHVPVLWVATDSAIQTFPFGTTIRLTLGKAGVRGRQA